MRDKNEFLSKSDNEKVLEIYQFVKKRHYTDYYYLGFGGEDLMRTFIKFEDSDWQDLVEDFEFWSTRDLKELVLAMMNLGEGFLLENTSTTSIIYQAILNFFKLFIPLLNIDRKRNSRTLHFYILHEIQFIEHYAPFLAKNDITIITTLKEIIRQTHDFSQITNEELFNKHSTSKSKNKKILNIYSKMISIANTDYEQSKSYIDYWKAEGQRLFLIFEQKDWNDLVEDLNNWTAEQRDILASCLLGKWANYYSYDVQALYNYIKN